MRGAAVLLSAALVLQAPSGAWARRAASAAVPIQMPAGALALPAASLPSSLGPAPLAPPRFELAAMPAPTAALAAAAAQASPAAAAIPARVPAAAASALPAGRADIAHEHGVVETKVQPAALAALEDTAARVADAAVSPTALRMAFDGSEARPAGASSVRAVYIDFLERLGFARYSRKAGLALSSSGVDPLRREVLGHNRRALRIFTSASRLAGSIMEGLHGQRYSAEAIEKAADLTARLIQLRPLSPPARLPEQLAAGLSSHADPAARLADWIGEATARRIDRQIASVTADVLDTIHGAGELQAALRDPAGARALELLSEAAGLAVHVERLLLTQYADLELGETRFAGRALAASLLRYGLESRRPEVRQALEAALGRRGFRLSDYVGDTAVVPRRSGRAIELTVRTGDILGLRSRTRKASEITVALRPHDSLLAKARRLGVLGSIWGVFITPYEDKPRQVPGQPVRNALRAAVHSLRRWVADWPVFLRGFSHAGIAVVEEADGVRMVWVYESDLNSAEGGLRKVGFADQFLQPDYYVRFGLARMNPERAAAEFLRQARERGWRDDPYPGWPRGISPEAWGGLVRLAETDPRAFLEEVNRRALRQLDFMMSELGVAYATDFKEKLYRAYCGLSIWLAYLLGALFDVQPLHDQWHPLARALKKVGYGNAQGLDMQARVIWPASFFLDPKMEEPVMVDMAGPRPPGRRARLMPDYVERDPELARMLGGLRSHRRAREEVARLLRLRREKRERARAAGQDPWRAGVSPATGYFAGIEELYARHLGEEMR